MSSFFLLQRGVQILCLFNPKQTPRSDSANPEPSEPISCLGQVKNPSELVVEATFFLAAPAVFTSTGATSMSGVYMHGNTYAVGGDSIRLDSAFTDGKDCVISEDIMWQSSPKTTRASRTISTAGASSRLTPSDSSQFPSTCSSLPLVFGCSNVVVNISWCVKSIPNHV